MQTDIKLIQKAGRGEARLTREAYSGRQFCFPDKWLRRLAAHDVDWTPPGEYTSRWNIVPVRHSAAWSATRETCRTILYVDCETIGSRYISTNGGSTISRITNISFAATLIASRWASTLFRQRHRYGSCSTSVPSKIRRQDVPLSNANTVNQVIETSERLASLIIVSHYVIMHYSWSLDSTSDIYAPAEADMRRRVRSVGRSDGRMWRPCPPPLLAARWVLRRRCCLRSSTHWRWCCRHRQKAKEEQPAWTEQ